MPEDTSSFGKKLSLVVDDFRCKQRDNESGGILLLEGSSDSF